MKKISCKKCLKGYCDPSKTVYCDNCKNDYQKKCLGLNSLLTEAIHKQNQ